ncbi:MAG TPA: SdpI family protein [Prolixibacteraceae bacterium]|nr:SdpI family protein [Prolixibacteraceae bacterium]
MKNQTIRKELLLILLTAIPIAYLLFNWSLLPDQMPIHFDFNGEPNGYGSRIVFLFLPLGLYLLMLILPLIDPKKHNYEIFSDTYFKLRIILSVFIGIIDSLIIYNVLHGIEKMGLLIPILIMLIFTLLGNYMGNIRPNYFVGIKVPWTLNNDVVWIRTHKLAGKLWFWGGLIGIAALFIFKNPTMVMVPLMLIITVVPIVYSYIIYQKIANQH